MANLGVSATNYGYEYFCGANVTVDVEGMPVLEVAGISYNIMDSAQPIYGYCSRLFDAVAPGQQIVQGSIVINFVNPDYLFNSINRGRGMGAPDKLKTYAAIDRLPETSTLLTSKGRAIANSTSTKTVVGVAGLEGTLESMWTGARGNTSASAMALITNQMENEIWGPEASEAPISLGADPSFSGPFNINISFANKYSIMLNSCFIVGRGSAIQIDENVLVEEYSFFARSYSTGRYT